MGTRFYRNLSLTELSRMHQLDEASLMQGRPHLRTSDYKPLRLAVPALTVDLAAIFSVLNQKTIRRIMQHSKTSQIPKLP